MVEMGTGPRLPLPPSPFPISFGLISSLHSIKESGREGEGKGRKKKWGGGEGGGRRGKGKVKTEGTKEKMEW